MKNIIKNIVSVIILSGLFFIPVLSSAQTTIGIVNANNNSSGLQLYSVKSQAEIEAIEVMLILEAKSNRQHLYIKDTPQNISRFFTSNSNVTNNYKSQAEVEAEEGLFSIQNISVSPNLNTIDLLQASGKQSSLISNIMAANYGDEISLLENLR